MNHQLSFCAAMTSLLLVTAGCTTEQGDPQASSSSGTTSSSSSGNGGGSTSSSGPGGAGGAGGAAQADMGWVFSMSNAAAGNELIVFERAEDGSLSARNSLPTGGLGSGDGLGSQGALTLSASGEYLYVVNAGSNQLSSFRIYDDHIALVDLVSSGGERPVSVTADDDHVYVVNAGGDGSVQGFNSEDGVLDAVSDQPLSAPGSGPAQVGLLPDGSALIVTEKATNNLLTYWVAPDGSLSQATVTASQGTTPFGFDYAPGGVLLVSEAFGGMDNASAVSSYTVGGVEPEAVSASVASGQSAACWLVVAGNFAYVTNTKSSTVSGYSIADDGSINLFDDGGITVDLGADQGPLDAALASDDAYLYVLNGKSDTVVGFSVADDGSLEPMADSVPVPATGIGLVAR